MQTYRDRARDARLEEARMLDLARERILELEEHVEQLQAALDSRMVIEQAKGMLADRLSVTLDEAFEILRDAAHSHGAKLHEMGERVILEPETPAPVVIALARRQRARAAWMREIAEAHAARVEELHRTWHEQMQKLQRDAAGRVTER